MLCVNVCFDVICVMDMKFCFNGCRARVCYYCEVIELTGMNTVFCLLYISL